MSSPHTGLPEIQQAAITALKGYAPLAAKVTKIADYGAIPENQPFPYIAVGDQTEVPMHTFKRKGYEDTFTFHIWSDQRGFEECYEILSLMNEVLDAPEEPLELPNHHFVGTWYEFCETLNDPGEDDVRHMPVRYRSRTQE